MAICNIVAVQRWVLRTRLRHLCWRDSTSLDGCREKVKRFIQHITHAPPVNTYYLQAAKWATRICKCSTKISHPYPRVSCRLWYTFSADNTGTDCGDADQWGNYAKPGKCSWGYGERCAWRKTCSPHRWILHSACLKTCPRKRHTPLAAHFSPSILLTVLSSPRTTFEQEPRPYHPAN